MTSPAASAPTVSLSLSCDGVTGKRLAYQLDLVAEG